MAIPITPSVLETLVSYVTTLHTCTSIYADQYPTVTTLHTCTSIYADQYPTGPFFGPLIR
jgi:hemoglobin-like flavoprotein